MTQKHIQQFVIFLLCVQSSLLSYSLSKEEVVWKSIPPFTARLDSSWLVTDFLEETKLYYSHLFHIDFEPNGTMWLATSEGLFRYDGYQWERFTEKDGLPSSFVRCVLVTRENDLWVGTDQGAGIFRERRFDTLDSENNLAGPSIRRIVEDRDGSLWFCCDPWPEESAGGGLTAFRNGEWMTFREEDGLPSDHVMKYFRDSSDRQYALTAEGLAVFRDGHWINPLQEAGFDNTEMTVWDIVEIPGQGVFVSTTKALFILEDDTWKKQTINLSQSPRFCTTHDRRLITSMLLGGTHRGFFQWDINRFQLASYAFHSLAGDVECVKEAPDGSVWSVGYNCLARWERKNQRWTKYSELPTPQLRDGDGRIWFAGEKLIVKDEKEWYEVSSSHRSFLLDADQGVWSWSNEEIIHWIDRDTVSYAASEIGFQQISGLVADPSGSIWAYGIDVKKQNQIAYFDETNWHKKTPEDFQSVQIVGGQPDSKEGIWLLTNHSSANHYVFHYLNKTQQKTVPLVVGRISERDGSFNFAIDPSRNLWVYGDRLLSIYKYGSPTVLWDSMSGILDRTVFALFFREGEEWVALRGKNLFHGGIAILEPKREGWIFYRGDTRECGIKDDQDMIYIGGYEKVFMIPPDWNQPPIQLTLPEPQPVLRLVKGKGEKLWLQVDHSVLCYQPDGIPPETFISNSPERIVEGSSIRIQCSGRMKNMPSSRPREMLFSWQVNYGEWNDFQTLPDGGLPLAGLRPGKHVIRVRAQDEDFDVDSTPAAMHITVYPLSMLESAWFKSFVFMIMMVIGILALVAFRARRKLAMYAGNLEAMVDERTHALQASEAKYRDLVQNANSIILRITPEGKITFFNEFAQMFFGYSSEEIQDKNVLDTIFPKEETRGRELSDVIHDLLVSPDQYAYHECENVKKDGNKVWVAWTSKAVFDKKGNLTELLCIGSDITAHKRAEEERKRLETQLLHSQKLEAVGLLAGGIAHDFNNLLTGIIGNINLAQMDASTKMKKYLSVAAKAADRTADLVQQLLLFSRKSQVEMKQIQINEIVENVSLLLQETVDQHIEIITHLRNDIPAVKGDPLHLHSLLMNLCTNAQEAIHRILWGEVLNTRQLESFSITMETDFAEVGEAECKKNPQARQSTFVVVRVKDNGCGISPDIRDKIFEPFFTTKEVGKGSGLGLASVYGIVRKHKGWVSVTSEYGKGTEIAVFLPPEKS